MTALVLAYVAGLLTTLNPCVLPMIPLVVAGTATSHRLGPIAFAGGMVLSFTVVGLFIASIGIGMGIPPHVMRQASAVIFIALGLVLLLQPLQRGLAFATAGLATGAGSVATHFDRGGLGGAFAIGALAGAIWSPCSGPSFGAAVALAAEAGGLAPAALRMFVFGLGAVTILLALAYGSRRAVVQRRDTLLAASAWLRPATAVIFIAVGLSVLVGFDKTLEAGLLDRLPDWFVDFTTRF